MTYHKLFLSVLISLGLFFQVALVQAETPIGLDAIVAVVNNGVITQSQLASQVKIVTTQYQAAQKPLPPANVLKNQVLKTLIDKEIQMQIAKKIGLKVDDATVNNAIKSIADQNGISVADLQGKIQQEGLDYNHYRKEIHDEILLSQVQQKVVAPQVKISDQEIMDLITNHRSELFAANGNNSATPVTYHIQTILIPLADSATAEQIQTARDTAQQALEQLRSGSSFEQVANSKLGVQNNLQQNDLGWKKLDELPDLYSSVLKNLKSGSLSAPIQAPNGFHIIKLIAIQGQGADSNPFANMSETHVRHILIKTTPVQNDSQTKVRLERLRASILGGEIDFADAAKSNSQDPGSVAKGGDLGWMTSGVLDPTFENVMNGTSKGQISAPFKSQFGWHILQVLDRRSIANRTNVEKQRAREVIFQRKFNDELNRWLQNMRNMEYVKIFDQNL